MLGFEDTHHHEIDEDNIAQTMNEQTALKRTRQATP